MTAIPPSWLAEHYPELHRRHFGGEAGAPVPVPIPPPLPAVPPTVAKPPRLLRYEAGPVLFLARLPIRLLSAANAHELPFERAHRVQTQRQEIGLLMAPHRGVVAPPCRVRMIRVAPRGLDDDNLPNALKHVRDEIADWLGLPNDRDPRVVWECADRAEAPRVYGVEIQIRVVENTA
jgi:hypothetical protein